MMLSTRDLDWVKMDESIPAFITVIATPFTFSTVNGITLGILSFFAIHLLTAQWRNINSVMATLSVLLVCSHAS